MYKTLFNLRFDLLFFRETEDTSLYLSFTGDIHVAVMYSRYSHF